MSKYTFTGASIPTEAFKSNSTAVLIVDGVFVGSIELQIRVPDEASATWFTISIVTTSSAIPLNTPALFADYRLKPTLTSGTAKVWFGSSYE